MALPHTTILETGRLRLRALTPVVYDTLFTQCTDTEIMDFLGLNNREELAEERARQMAGRSTWRTSFVNFQMVDKTSGAMIGHCGFHTWYLQHRRAEIGYALSDDAHKRKGYMTEALKAVMDYGFREMDLNRVEAFIGTQNQASIRLVTAIGFTHEGQMRGHYCKNGVIEDSLIYGLLRDEYLAANKS